MLSQSNQTFAARDIVADRALHRNSQLLRRRVLIDRPDQAFCISQCLAKGRLVQIVLIERRITFPQKAIHNRAIDLRIIFRSFRIDPQ